MGKVELLAPAGDMTCFRAAVSAGADAVYLGGEAYGARAYASNFTKDELCEAIRYAHLFGVKVYLTVNTLVKERELEGLPGFIAPFYEAGLDGVIVQDLGVLKILKEQFPGLLLHGSTQMCVTGKYGAELLKKYGVCRVVPARELSLDEIREIKKETRIEVETFIHGAMCYSYSGQCLFSSFLGGRSGNRGRCAGPCRLPYSAFGKKEVYPLSLKDLCALPILDELMDAGIDSFKIEGRMKNAYYVAGVTAVYRKYIDLYEAAKAGGAEYRIAEADLEILRKLYVRTELETGYYHRHNGPEMVTLQKPGYLSVDEKEFAWIRDRFLDQDRKIKLQCELKVRKGYPLLLSVWDRDGRRVEKSGQSPIAGALNRPAKTEDVKKQLAKTGNTPFLFQSISVIMGEDVFIPVKEINELRRQALEEMKRMLTGISERETRMSAPETLQTAAETVLSTAAETVPESVPETEETREHTPHQKSKKIRIAVTTKEQFQTALAFAETYAEPAADTYSEPIPETKEIAGIELHFQLLECLEETLGTGRKDIPLYLCMPRVFRKRAAEYCDRHLTDDRLRRFSGFYCGGLDALEYIAQRLKKAGIAGGEKEIFADYSLYTCNTEAVSFLERLRKREDQSRSMGIPSRNEGKQLRSGETQYQISGFVGSYELNRHEWEDLVKGCRRLRLDHLKKEYLVYGHIPFMQTAGCVKKTFGRCDGQNAVTYLKDRMGKTLPVMNVCQICENTVYNGVPLSLYREREQIACDYERINFTIEDASFVEAVLDGFLLRKPQALPEFTKGHFKKGIE